MLSTRVSVAHHHCCVEAFDLFKYRWQDRTIGNYLMPWWTPLPQRFWTQTTVLFRSKIRWNSMKDYPNNNEPGYCFCICLWNGCYILRLICLAFCQRNYVFVASSSSCKPPRLFCAIQADLWLEKEVVSCDDGFPSPYLRKPDSQLSLYRLHGPYELLRFGLQCVVKSSHDGTMRGYRIMEQIQYWRLKWRRDDTP